MFSISKLSPLDLTIYRNNSVPQKRCDTSLKFLLNLLAEEKKMTLGVEVPHQRALVLLLPW